MYPCIYGRGISINNVCRQFLPPVTHAITDRLPSRKKRETETVEKYTFGTKSQFAVYSTHVYSFKTENWLNRKNIIRHSSTTSSYILKDTFAYVYIYIYIYISLSFSGPVSHSGLYPSLYRRSTCVSWEDLGGPLSVRAAGHCPLRNGQTGPRGADLYPFQSYPPSFHGKTPFLVFSSK